MQNTASYSQASSNGTSATLGILYDFQIAANLLRQAGRASIQIGSQDRNKATYEVQDPSINETGTHIFKLLLNAHRVRTDAGGEVDLDVASTNDNTSPVLVTEAFPQVTANSSSAAQIDSGPVSRELTSGTVTTVHNLANFTAQHTFNALTWDLTGTCSCPVKGSLLQAATAADGSRQAAHTYVFTGCGQAIVTSHVTTAKGSVDGSRQVTWANCN